MRPPPIATAARPTTSHATHEPPSAAFATLSPSDALDTPVSAMRGLPPWASIARS